MCVLTLSTDLHNYEKSLKCVLTLSTDSHNYEKVLCICLL